MATTVTTKPNWSAAVSGVVGVAVSILLHFWTKVDVGWVVLFTLPLSYAYHWLIATGEKRFPWLSVFFLALPQNLPTPVTPIPTPTPPVTPPAPAPAASTFVFNVAGTEKGAEDTKTPPTAAKPKSPKTKR